jgi:hypothetical protein
VVAESNQQAREKGAEHDHYRIRLERASLPIHREMPSFAKGHEAYHSSMSRLHPECPHSDPFDHLVVADVLLVRQEPNEEEDEEEDEGNGKEDKNGDEDEENDDGYSE